MKKQVVMLLMLMLISVCCFNKLWAEKGKLKDNKSRVKNQYSKISLIDPSKTLPDSIVKILNSKSMHKIVMRKNEKWIASIPDKVLDLLTTEQLIDLAMRDDSMIGYQQLFSDHPFSVAYYTANTPYVKNARERKDFEDCLVKYYEILEQKKLAIFTSYSQFQSMLAGLNNFKSMERSSLYKILGITLKRWNKYKIFVPRIKEMILYKTLESIQPKIFEDKNISIKNFYNIGFSTLKNDSIIRAEAKKYFQYKLDDKNEKKIYTPNRTPIIGTILSDDYSQEQIIETDSIYSA